MATGVVSIGCDSGSVNTDSVEASRRKVISLIGPPGSGKSLQGKRLAARKPEAFCYLALGDAFRGLTPGHALAELVQPFVRKGQLVPDDLTLQVLNWAINRECKVGRYNPQEQILLLDGIPRTVEQADELCAEQYRLLGCVHFVCDDQTAVARICHRATDAPRSDDDVETIRRRLRIYHEQTAPVVPYLMKKLRRGKKIVLSLPTDRSESMVFDRLCHSIEQIMGYHRD